MKNIFENYIEKTERFLHVSAKISKLTDACTRNNKIRPLSVKETVLHCNVYQCLVTGFRRKSVSFIQSYYVTLFCNKKKDIQISLWPNFLVVTEGNVIFVEKKHNKANNITIQSTTISFCKPYQKIFGSMWIWICKYIIIFDS